MIASKFNEKVKNQTRHTRGTHTTTRNGISQQDMAGRIERNNCYSARCLLTCVRFSAIHYNLSFVLKTKEWDLDEFLSCGWLFVGRNMQSDRSTSVNFRCSSSHWVFRAILLDSRTHTTISFRLCFTNRANPFSDKPHVDPFCLSII